MCGRQRSWKIFFCCVIKLCFVRHKYSWVVRLKFGARGVRGGEGELWKCVKTLTTTTTSHTRLSRDSSRCLSGALLTTQLSLEWVLGGNFNALKSTHNIFQMTEYINTPRSPQHSTPLSLSVCTNRCYTCFVVALCRALSLTFPIPGVQVENALRKRTSDRSRQRDYARILCVI